ncbi:phosphate ABC transporter permease PstA [Mycoplasma marinum]|uniref:Phosphate transport system permease protein PstA n=1 Tax=Mycoplasma marinum TaxID=1937190 RepID=A0A4R0XQ95_9MOLU|nr:phosphate ABC transporter permease PstA [Mycoplasma marinum]TCG11745.1 phosphate ABC transporter permease PtsA [Mycoplasma marinum]
MINNSTKHIQKKNILNKLFKSFVLLVSFVSASIILMIIGFVFIKTLPMFKDENWAHKFNSTYGIIDGLITTFVIAFLSLIIAMWIGTRIAIFIFFKIKNKKLKSIFRFINELLAGIPSVVFGLFGIFALSPLVAKIFNANFTSGSVYSVIIVLTMMIIPTISSLTLNALKGVPDNYYNGALALGNTTNQSIYKVVLKSIRKQRIVITVLSVGRVIGETMAVSMLIQSHPINPFSHSEGFLGFLRGNSGNVATIIPNNMFPQSGDVSISRGYVYSIGLIILIFILIINGFTAYIFRTKKIKKVKKVTTNKYILIKNSSIEWFQVNILEYVSKIKSNIINYIMFFVKNKDLKKRILYQKRKTFSEILAVSIGFSLVFWIFGYVLVKGGQYFEFSHLTNIQKGHGDTVGKALIVTCILVFGAILLCLPFAMCLAIWFSEYSSKSKISKVMKFLMDALQSTPSILFGMFGMVFFIQTLKMGKTFSLTAGILTMSIVILPMFTRTVEQSLQNVSQTLRNASLALGASKVRTIFKIVIPTALKGVITGIILSIGRVISETAPVYLVMGLSPAWHIKSNSGAQVLTTRIYVNATTPSDLIKGDSWAWEAAFVAMILIIFLYLLANIVGWYLNKKSEGKLKFKNLFKIKKRGKLCKKIILR